MLSRIDGISSYIAFSENINVWPEPVKIQEPKYPWEFIQIGNCGAPIETSEGWLVITRRRTHASVFLRRHPPRLGQPYKRDRKTQGSTSCS